MSVFRVEKNSNYTVMSNYHLRDKRLSLRTIGLLSLILSLPQDWDYSQAGLVAICKDGPDSVAAGLRQLEDFGYLERIRERDAKGRVHGVIYRVYEAPKDVIQQEATSSNHDLPKRERPKQEIPEQVKPKQALPHQDSPDLVKQPQINKDKQNTDINKNPSINQSKEGLIDGHIQNKKQTESLAVEKIIKQNIGYDYFVYMSNRLNKQLAENQIEIEEYEFETYTYNLTQLDKIIRYMIDVVMSINTDPIKIGHELINREMVKSKMMKVDMMAMKKAVFELSTNQNIKNPKNYVISLLYNY